MERHPLDDQTHLYQALESGPDGQPGGILITSFAQEVLPNVWIGGFKACEDLPFLQKNRITVILSLGHFTHQYPSDQFTHKIVPIADNPEANIIHHFPATNAFIQDALSSNQRILVHCLAGVSRSPTVVAAYLMHQQRIHPKQALSIIKQNRPFVNPNPGFMDQLRLYREMDFEFDPHHPAYLAWIKKHPIDASHAGHAGYRDIASP
ncbi:protein-tyrosine phosphatase-like protein [Syncephalastrum racemosum]|uniref:protein-tyrosine-phosphatase n=1 Tax=Syncephalastrum racemosum TaxID=13706 RepID=A0A1X2H7H4_SYNRA|nr:protein-tyrosine phosphatase-like protein [Syncephalastrum racemosum]